MLRKKHEFESSLNKYLQIARDFVKVCPKCNSIHITTRTRKKPKYKCQDCDNEFDDPKAKIEHITLKQQGDYARQYPNPDE